MFQRFGAVAEYWSNIVQGICGKTSELIGITYFVSAVTAISRLCTTTTHAHDTVYSRKTATEVNSSCLQVVNIAHLPDRELSVPAGRHCGKLAAAW